MSKTNLGYQLLLNGNYDENSIEYKKLMSSLQDLEYIQTDLNTIILDQNNKLKNINTNNNSILENLNKSNEDLKICNKYYFSYKPIIIGSCIGALFISPVTSILGLKYLGVSLSVGGLIGGYSGYKLQV